MTARPGKPQKPEKEHADNSPDAIPNGTIYSYNLDSTQTPGGLKVRFKVRVVTGPDADRYEARLNNAIREALLWTRQHLMEP